MKTLIKIILGSMLIASLVPDVELKAQVGKSAYGQEVSRAIGAKTRNNSGTYLKRGFKGIVEVSAGGDLTGTGVNAGANLSLGYQFNPYVYLGGFVGSGFPAVFVGGVDFRGYFTKTKIAPFFGLQAGYGHGYYWYYTGGYGYHSGFGPGFYWGAGPGVRFGFRNNIGLSLQPAVKMVIGVPYLFDLSINVAVDF